MKTNSFTIILSVLALLLFSYIIYNEKEYREHLICDDTLGADPFGYPMNWTTPGNPIIMGMYN